MGWHSLTGDQYCYVPAERPAWGGGLLPIALPQLPEPILIRSKPGGTPGYILYIPPHQSIQILFTHKSDQPGKFKGRLVYDPVAPRNAFGVTKAGEGPPWVSELVSSNEFEYEVHAHAGK